MYIYICIYIYVYIYIYIYIYIYMYIYTNTLLNRPIAAKLIKLLLDHLQHLKSYGPIGPNYSAGNAIKFIILKNLAAKNTNLLKFIFIIISIDHTITKSQSAITIIKWNILNKT